MQKALEQKVRNYCESHHMLSKNDAVVLGVSGGADSVCLLFMMLMLQKELDLKLHVVHVNHRIRTEAAEDAAYVKRLCDTHQIPFYLYEEDVPELAKKWGCGEEEAGRKVRYHAFSEICKLQNCQKIAVAHNANDRAETMLFHLFRGTGLTGLAGIAPVREQIIRPLLCLERAEIEAYLKAKQITYQHDCTNDLDEYTRNKIRHNILAYAEKEIVQGAVANMSRSADILAETENYIEEQVKKALIACVDVSKLEDMQYVLSIEPFLQEHVLIQKRLLLYLLKELSPTHKDIAAIHVEDILTLFTREGNRKISLPYGMCGYRQYEKVVLERPTELVASKQWEPIPIELETLTEKELCIPLGRGRRVYLKLLYGEKEAIISEEIPQNQYTKWFDYDKIKECLMLRTRSTGDFLCIRGQETLQHKKLKDYMVTEKVPKKRREEPPLLTEGSHVLWVIGYRISEYYKVDASTKTILQVRFTQSNRIEKV